MQKKLLASIRQPSDQLLDNFRCRLLTLIRFLAHHLLADCHKVSRGIRPLYEDAGRFLILMCQQSLRQGPLRKWGMGYQ